jgi:rhodanese-related sulfurtransferase
MKSITPAEFVALGPDAHLIDVREPDELKTVRTEQAQPLPMSTLNEHLADLPEGPIYVMCHSGGRSAKVTAFLEQQGYDAINVEGGITAWQAAGLPTVQG